MITSVLRHKTAAGPAGRRTALRKTRTTLTTLAATAALAAGGGAVALAGTAGTAGSAGSAATATAAVPRCLEGSLATGLYGYETGNYDGNGYTGLGLQNARHRVVRSRTHWGPTYFAPDPGRHLIVLSPGETASTSIGFVYGGRRKAHASYLEVTPPGAYDHAVITIPDGVGTISNGNLYVTAMARHTPFQGSTGQCCSG